MQMVTKIDCSLNGIALRGSVQDITISKEEKVHALIYLMLNLPYRCNYRCLKCCNIFDGHQPVSETVPEFNKAGLRPLLAAAKNAGVRVLVVAGEGEPLIDSDFRHIIELASAEGLLPYVFTNGSLLNDDIVRFLAKHRSSLIISLDSMEPERYKRLTGGCIDLSKVLDNITRCRKVYSHLIEQNNSRRIGSLAINMVVNTINYDEVENVRDFCGDDVVFVCNQPTRIGLAEKNWSFLYGETPCNADVDSIIARMSEFQQPLGTTRDGKWCAYMRNGLSVSPDGQVLTCAYSLETAGLYNAPNFDDLVATNRDVMQSVQEFYDRCGHSRCILRHPKYKDFIAFLKARKEK
jgi:MoaA/NifB/PqqE/SkfB family radical SAM enzyme